jgi:hypothetical protein
MDTTSGHIKPCKIGQSEAHNERKPEYLANINRAKIYIHEDLSSQNSKWISPRVNGDLQQYYDEIKAMVKEKTGRKLQEGDRVRTDKKTGKQKIISGSSPLREEVVVCKADTTIDELRNYAQACHDLWGITAIQMFIHRDEGHYENPTDKKSWKPNYHAHIVWDWMNHETGKSCKLDPKDMSKMQDLLAENLHMERGKSKSETGREHLERNDFILAKQKQELADVRAEQAKVEADTAAKQEQSASLDKAIADKNAKLNEELKENAIAKALSFIGGGELSKARKDNEAKDKEIAKLSSELDAAKHQIATMRAEHAQQLNDIKSEGQGKLDRAIARAESAEARLAEKDNIIRELDRQVNPQRYQLSSGAELLGMRYFATNPYTCTVRIETKVGLIVHNPVTYINTDDSRLKAMVRGELTEQEFVNKLFRADEQVNAEQSHLLAATIEMLSGGPAQAHVGTGGGGSTASDSRWDGKTRDDFLPKRKR